MKRIVYSVSEKSITKHQLLADLYYKTGRFRESCDHMKLLYKIQEELSTEEKTRILAEMQTRFEVQQRDMTIGPRPQRTPSHDEQLQFVAFSQI